MSAAMQRCVGIDPGATTGLICVDVPADGPHAGDISRGRFVAFSLARASTSTTLTDAEQDASLGRRIRSTLIEWAPDLVVLEEPADAAASWANAGRRAGRAQGTATAFALGRAYGCALMAASDALQARGKSVARGIYAYPVTTRKGKALGWMQHRASTPTPRATTLQRMTVLAMSLRPSPTAPGTYTVPPEDCLMALGVLHYHLTHGHGAIASTYDRAMDRARAELAAAPG